MQADAPLWSCNDAKAVTIVEVGPRDGLQNEHAIASRRPDKIAFVNLLSAAGLPVIEVSAFVSPEVGAADGRRRRGVRRDHRVRPGVRYTALVPNVAGLERALQARRRRDRDLRAHRPRRSAARTSTRASTSRWRPIARSAIGRSRAGLRVRGYLSTAFGCPFEGDGSAGAGGRTSQDGSPRLGRVRESRSATRSASRTRDRSRACSTRSWRALPLERIALHFHDTRGTALANVLASLRYGVATFDASAGGLGGCPLRTRRGRQPRHRRSDLHAGWNGNRNRVSLDALEPASAFIEI